MQYSNVFMLFSISVFRPELLLLWPELQVSKLKLKVIIPKNRLSNVGLSVH